MFSTLRARLLTLVLVFGLLMAGAFALTVYLAHRNYYSEVMQGEGMDFARRAVSHHPELWSLAHTDPAAAGRLLHEFALMDPATGVYVLDNEGAVVATAGKPQTHWATWKVDLAPLRMLLDGGRRGGIIGDDPDRAGSPCLISAAPLLESGVPRGYLYIIMRAAADHEAHMMVVRSNTIRAALISGAVVLVFGLLFTTAMTGLLTRPLRQLTAVINRVRAGGFETPVENSALPYIDRKDEIGTLSSAFRDMLERLRAQMQQVQRTDALRRELVESVSHDLRTPLTSLTGHLETIKLKGAQFNPEEQHRFIDVALENARQLDKLTSSLFELARLDSGEVKIEREPLMIGELADDVVHRFSARALEKNIALATDYPDGLPIMTADAALIERALANLIENALRYTPQNGRITVAARAEKDRMALSVSDSGSGIDANDIGNVFERFFQGSRFREGRGHAGLGLAIVKRVCERHGGQVSVVNNAGPGCTFTLLLPLGA
jgi:signal transduction histidine kinase